MPPPRGARRPMGASAGSARAARAGAPGLAAWKLDGKRSGIGFELAFLRLALAAAPAARPVLNANPAGAWAASRRAPFNFRVADSSGTDPGSSGDPFDCARPASAPHAPWPRSRARAQEARRAARAHWAPLQLGP